jgi:hypothetical protein
MKKLLTLIAVIPPLLFGAANDIKVQQNSGGVSFPDRIFPGQSAISTTLASYLSSVGLGTEDSPTFTVITLSGATPLTLAGGGTVTAASGNISLVASGTNQNITVTPSGTGFVQNGAGTFGVATGYIGLSGSGVTAFPTSGGFANSSRIYATDGSGGAYPFQEFGHLVLQSRVGTARDILFVTFNGSATAARGVIKSTGEFLIGTTTNGSNGRIQLATGTAITDGISQSTHWSIYSPSSGAVTLATNSGVSALTVDSSQNITYTATMRVSTDTLSGAGAIVVTKDTTKYTSTGDAQALTLADGSDGQIKRIMHVVDGGSGVLTPTTKTGFSTVTFTNAGDSVTLEFVTTQGWIVIGSYGATIAP